MRRLAAAALALLLTGSPAVAAACALVCPAASTDATAAVSATDMPADCAAMHHAADAAAAPSGVGTASDARLARTEANGCCSLSAAPGDLPPASVDHTAPRLTVSAAVTIVHRVAVAPRLMARTQASPPRASTAHARRTDVLRL